MSKVMLACAALVAVVLVMPPGTGDAGRVPHFAGSIADLNPARHPEATALLGRITAAVRAVCGRSVRAWVQVRDCFKAVLENAATRIGEVGVPPGAVRPQRAVRQGAGTGAGEAQTELSRR